MKLLNPTPTKISFLVLDGATMLTVASVMDPLRAANRVSREKLFEWEILSQRHETIKLVGDFEMKADKPFSQTQGGDFLIIIASFFHDKHANTQLIQTIRKLTTRFDNICGIEAGAWVLARAGIIKNHKVTTHWEDLENLSLNFPDIDVRKDRYIIDENIWTCGGASPALDMMLYLMENRYGKTLALDVASVFIYDQTHPSTDAQPNISIGRLAQKEPRISKALRIMEQNIESPIPVAEIAKQLGVSVKTQETLFTSHLHETPAAYYLRLRLITAKKLLLDTNLSIQEIAIRSGFNSQSAFSRSFTNHLSLSPRALRIRGY